MVDRGRRIDFGRSKSKSHVVRDPRAGAVAELRFEHSANLLQVCGPLHAGESLKKTLRRENLAGRAFNMWRYSELLPLPEGYVPHAPVGGTPLLAARKLGTQWGVKSLFLKNDGVCFPSLSFKDRVVATALAACRPLAGTDRCWGHHHATYLQGRACCAAVSPSGVGRRCALRA